MQYCELMFGENTSNGQCDGRIKSRLSFRDKRLYYKISAEIFTGDQIYEMIEVMNYIWRTYNQKIPITFDLGEFEFYDKLVYVILESLCYYLLKEKGHSIKILFNAKHTIWSEGICYSPLKNIGDADINTTMNIYAEVHPDMKKKSLTKMAGKIIISRSDMSINEAVAYDDEDDV